MLKLIPVVLVLISLSCVFGQQASVKKVPKPSVICKLKPVPGTKLLKMVKPAYPTQVDANALTKGVVVHLTIDKQGFPKDLQVTKGDPAMTRPVLDALRQWRWKPYKLNGEAVEVESNLYVRFEPGRD